MGRRSPHGAGKLGTPLGIVFVTVVVDLIGFGTVLPLLPLWADTFGASAVTIGLLTATYSLAQFVFAPILGRLSDRVGRRPVILTALAGSAVASLTIGLAGTLWVLFLARALDGTSGASYVVAQAYVADMTTGEERARGMGMIGAAFGIGLVLGPAIGAASALASPRLPFFVASAMAATNLAVAYRRLPESRRPGQAPSVSVERFSLLRRALASANLAPLVWVSFVGTFAFVGMESTFALFGARRLAFGLVETGLMFAYVGILSATVQGVLVRRLVPRFGELRLMRAGLLTTALALALLGLSREVWEVLLAGVPLALGSGLVFPTLTSLVSRRSGAHEQGGVLGVLASTGGLARVTGPIVATVLFQQVGIPAPYLVGAALFLGCLALVTRRIDLPLAAPSGPVPQ